MNITTFGGTFTVENRNMVGGQPSVRLDTDKQWTSPPGRHAFVRKQFAFETQSEGSFLKARQRPRYHQVYYSNVSLTDALSDDAWCW